MNFDEYQELAARTANRKLDEKRLAVSGLGLSGEAGEVVELIKKHIGHGHVLNTEAVAKELGDVLWYVADICTAVGIDMADVAEANIAKLRARYPEGFSEDRSRNRGEP